MMFLLFVCYKYSDIIQVLIILAYLIILSKTQIQSGNNDYFSNQLPDDCKKNEYYNELLPRCIECKNTTHQVNKNKDGCGCKNGYKLISFNSLSPVKTICQECNSNNSSNLAVSHDDLECVHCYSNNNTLLNPDPVTGKCYVCEAGFMPFLNKSFSPFRETCIPCKINSENSFDKCSDCRYGECYKPTPNELNNLEESALVTSLLNPHEKFLHNYIKENILQATFFCTKGIKKECNHLANMCVLQNYEISNKANNACSRLQSIIQKNMYTWTEYVPGIFYNIGDTSIELNKENAINESFYFGKKDLYDNKKLLDNTFQMIANIYSINGTFIGQNIIEYLDLQLCTGMFDDINGFTIFGKQYSYTCLLTFNDFEMREKNLFYELFLTWYSHEDNMSHIYPIFIINLSLQSNSHIKIDDEYLNDNCILSKRFYVIENTFESNFSPNIMYRYADNFKLIIPLQKNKNGKIWPPYALISYKEVPKKNETISYKHKFSVFFTQKEPDDSSSIDILLAILCTISILWAAIKSYSWSKRSGKMIGDIKTLIQLLLYECDNVANIFIIVIIIASVWCTIAFKAQTVVVFILPLNENVFHYKTYIMVALLLKFISIIRRYIELILADTFFIDWEKPKGEFNEKDKNELTTKTGVPPSIKINNNNNKSIVKSIGIWRTYFIANEWNELQNYRKINIALQLFMTLVLFEVINFKNISIAEHGFNFSDRKFEVNYYSPFFRFGVISVIYFGVLLVQWSIRVLIIEPLTDPFHNFIDLCSIANISVISLSHSLHGYYIHGQSPHGYAETTMQEINKFLQLEKNNQCGFRGLEGGNDLQTFILTMPKSFREKLLKIQGSIRQSTVAQIKIRNGQKTTENIEYRSKVYDELNMFLRKVIEHDDPECDYDISNMTIMEDLFEMEFNDTINRGIFYRDNSETSFTELFIYGNEWVISTFEFCLLQVIDVISGNLLVATVITYIISQIIKKIASIFFTSHLIKSSLIDHRFLI